MIPLLASLLLAQSGPSDLPFRDYPLQPSFSFAESDRVTALALVECLGPGRRGERLYTFGSPDPDGPTGAMRRTWEESVRVLDSTALPQGAQVRIVVPGAPYETPSVHMKPGFRYLVLAALPKGGRLEMPSGHIFKTGTSTAPALPGEVSGLAAFDTRAVALDGSPNLADRIANSVADCIPGADALGAKRIADWFDVSGYPGGGRYNNLFGREPFPLSEKIGAYAEGMPPYARHRLFYTLCDWHVYGNEQKLVDALVALADEPGPFPSGDFWATGVLDFSRQKAARDKGYVPFRLEANRWADAILNAKNDKARYLLLTNVIRIPDEAHLKRLAGLLLTSASETHLQSGVRYFSYILGRPDLTPKVEYDEDASTWVNRDASLKELRERYGVVVP